MRLCYFNITILLLVTFFFLFSLFKNLNIHHRNLTVFTGHVRDSIFFFYLNILKQYLETKRQHIPNLSHSLSLHKSLWNTFVNFNTVLVKMVSVSSLFPLSLWKWLWKSSSIPKNINETSSAKYFYITVT